MNSRKSIEQLKGKLNIVGSNITRFRKLNNMSRQELSNALMIHGVDISYQSLYDIEMGTRTVVDYELCAIANILNTTSDELMKEFNDYLNKI